MAEALTIEQQRALAIATARARAAQAQAADLQAAREAMIADMSGTDKVLSNIGAGMADLGTGARGLWADMFGSDEEKKAIEREVAEKRQQDELLAQGTTGGKALQIAGNAAPLLVIPGLGVAANAGRGALAASGALSGGIGGALGTRGEGESRIANTAIGAGGGALLGAAAPEIGAAIRGTVNTIRHPLNATRRAIEAARSPLQTIGQNRANRMIEQAVTGEAERTARGQALGAVADDIQQQTAQRQARPGLPLTTAARTGSPDLARLETGSRTTNGAHWYDFDQAQARAADDMLTRATGSADDIAARRGMRSSNRARNYEQAMGSVDEPGFVAARDQLRANLDQAAVSPEASNPAVRNMLDTLRNEMDRLGEGFGPEHLATIRANLSSKFSPISQNAYQAVDRSSPATIGVLREVDNILNGATNGRWQDVVSGYARDSRALDQAKAASRVRGAFRDPETGRVLGTAANVAGDVPVITQHALGRALNAARTPGGGPGLSEGAQQQVNNLLADLRAQDITKLVKRSTTGGGGSDTAGNQIAAKAAGAAADALAGAAGGPMGPGLMRGIRNTISAPKDAALARALQDPELMAQILRQAQQAAPRAGGAWAPAESEIVQLIRAMRGQ